MCALWRLRPTAAHYTLARAMAALLHGTLQEAAQLVHTARE
jgi:hypothetical protein